MARNFLALEFQAVIWTALQVRRSASLLQVFSANIHYLVWSMPGGFTSGGGREGYQTVDEETPAPTRASKPTVSQAPPTAAPASGGQPTAPGAYQSV